MANKLPCRVELDVQGQVHTLEVEEGETILQTALDNGIELSHDCKMGVCMTCPAKLVSYRYPSCNACFTAGTPG